MHVWLHSQFMEHPPDAMAGTARVLDDAECERRAMPTGTRALRYMCTCTYIPTHEHTHTYIDVAAHGAKLNFGEYLLEKLGLADTELVCELAHGPKGEAAERVEEVHHRLVARETIAGERAQTTRHLARPHHRHAHALTVIAHSVLGIDPRGLGAQVHPSKPGLDGVAQRVRVLKEEGAVLLERVLVREEHRLRLHNFGVDDSQELRDGLARRGGHRVVPLEDRGNTRAPADGNSDVTLRAGQGITELKKMIRQVAGKYAHHTMGSLKIGGPGGRNAKKNDLVDGATVHCTYTYTAGNPGFGGFRGRGRSNHLLFAMMFGGGGGGMSDY